MKKILLVLLLTVSSGYASAGEFVTLSGFELWATTYAQDTIRLANVPMPLTNPDNCSGNDSYMVSNSLGSDSKERIFSVLMAAVIAEKSVRVFVEGCEQNLPAIKDVLIGS